MRLSLTVTLVLSLGCALELPAEESSPAVVDAQALITRPVTTALNILSEVVGEDVQLSVGISSGYRAGQYVQTHVRERWGLGFDHRVFESRQEAAAEEFLADPVRTAVDILATAATLYGEDPVLADSEVDDLAMQLAFGSPGSSRHEAWGVVFARMGWEASHSDVLEVVPSDNYAMGERYDGEALSLDFVDVLLSDVIRLLGNVGQQPIVAVPDLDVVVSVHETDIPWDRALDKLLSENGLGLRSKTAWMLEMPWTELAALPPVP